MATNISSKRPATELRCGNIKATIWQNMSEKGPFFSTTFSRPFKDQSGAWRNGTSFGLNDLEALINMAFEALRRFSVKPQAIPGLPQSCTATVLLLHSNGDGHLADSSPRHQRRQLITRRPNPQTAIGVHSRAGAGRSKPEISIGLHS